jgi:hypothetical protein
MPYAHHARGSSYKRRQYWTSYDAVGMTLSTFTAPGDIIPVEVTRTTVSGGWSYNTGNYGGSEIVIPLEGQYLVSFKLTSDRGSLAGSAIGQISGSVYLNGVQLPESTLKCGTVRNAMLESTSAGVSFAIYLNQADELQVRVFCERPGSGANYCGTAPDGVAISIVMIDTL